MTPSQQHLTPRVNLREKMVRTGDDAMPIQTKKVVDQVAAALLDMLYGLEHVNSTSDACYAAIDRANELFSMPLRKEDQK